MSELKARLLGQTMNEYGCDTKIYLKSEADKVIALLTDKANYNDYAYKHKSEELADTCRFYEEELRRHKYKRCLAMARWCASRVVVWATEGNEKKSDLYWKWKEKWLELAEKFKPNKEAK